MNPGEYNLYMTQASYQQTINMSFRDRPMKRFVNWLEGNLSKILFYSLCLSLLGYFFK